MLHAEGLNLILTTVVPEDAPILCDADHDLGAIWVGSGNGVYWFSSTDGNEKLRDFSVKSFRNPTSTFVQPSLSPAPHDSQPRIGPAPPKKPSHRLLYETVLIYFCMY